MEIGVGDRVKLITDIYEEGEDLPPGRIAKKGDILIVRKCRSNETVRPFSVSHEDVTDGSSFGVSIDEIEILKE